MMFGIPVPVIVGTTMIVVGLGIGGWILSSVLTHRSKQRRF
jgi:hypothetical protein